MASKKDKKSATSQEMIDTVWEMQDVLQTAVGGDYSKRCTTVITQSFDSNPLTLVTPSVNLLLDELEVNERKRVKAERDLTKTVEELQRQLKVVEKQAASIQDLSTPIMELWDDVLVLPVIGVVDTKRSADLMERLLTAVSDKQARYVILDITGVEIVDTKTADHFIKVIKAAQLLGSSCMLTGIRPAVAQTLVEIGVDLSSITTLSNLKEGLTECMRRIQQNKKETAQKL